MANWRIEHSRRVFGRERKFYYAGNRRWTHDRSRRRIYPLRVLALIALIVLVTGRVRGLLVRDSEPFVEP